MAIEAGPLREAIEILLADPRVAAVEMLPSPDRPSADGSAASVLVWPEAGWLARQLSEPLSANRRSLRSWQTTYDITYNKPDGAGAGANFIGWVSSFTAEPISATDMRDWVEGIKSRLLALPHQRVLDIGCGNGLLVEAIGPNCRDYAARDFSATAIEKLSEWLRSRPDLAHVHAVHGAADADFAEAGEFDLVIINSVCQYFPDAAYLERVLEAAWRSLAPGGHIVVGDARPASLQPILLSAIELSRAPPGMSVDMVRQAIHAAWLAQAELLVDPAFFDAFAQEHGGSARILLKAGASRCEMTRYRFDAILGKPDPAREPADRPQPDILPNIAALHDWIAAGATGSAGLRGCTNARLSQDVQASRLIRQMRVARDVAGLREMLGQALPDAVDPADLEDIARKAGLACEITPVRGDDEGRFDAWFGPAGSNPSPSVAASHGGDKTRFASQPLLMQTLRRLATSLQSELVQRLPGPLLPARILPALPADAAPIATLSKRARSTP